MVDLAGNDRKTIVERAKAMILSPTAAGLAEFADDPRWDKGANADVRPWTDDYVNLFGAVWRHMNR